MSKPTSTQPQVTDQKIYGSVPVKPLVGASNQPKVSPNTTVHGQRQIPTIRVKVIGQGDREAIINESDFDPDRHERLADLD